MSDVKGNKERFQLLLQQLELTEDAFVHYFEQAEIMKVYIQKRKKMAFFL